MSVTHRERDFSEMRDRDLNDRDRSDRNGDHEISLGTPTLLGIFFALALVCAAFFGFGYTLGRKSTPSPIPGTAATADRGLSDAFKAFKPSPASSAGAAPAAQSPEDLPAAPHGKPSSATAIVVPATAPPTSSTRPLDPDATIVGDPAPVRPVAAATRPASAPTTQAAAAAATQATAGSIVQVSAFRRQEDADMVASALRRKGYTVFIRQEPQDKYLHVQLGPYGSKKEAEAMKDRLSTDGFNAIVK